MEYIIRRATCDDHMVLISGDADFLSTLMSVYTIVTVAKRFWKQYATRYNPMCAQQGKAGRPACWDPHSITQGYQC